MFMKYFLFIFVVVQCVTCAKILSVIWTGSRSHHIATTPLLQALARKGHEVHLLSSFNDKVDIPTYKQELLTGILSNVTVPIGSTFDRILNFRKNNMKTAENFWENQAVQNVIKNKPNYDIVICFPFFSDHTFALAHHVNAPLIIFSSGSSFLTTNKYVANPNLPYNTHLFSNQPVDTFLGRLIFATFNMIFACIENYLFLPIQEEVKTKYLPEAPTLTEIFKNVSLIFINSHFSMEQQRPYVPNMIQIGGYNNGKVGKLPENLQKFLDSSTDGAVIFSMGTNVKIASNFGNKTEILMKTFEKFAPIKFLMKSEIEIPSAPANVLVVDWLPQNDVLAHANVKLFISHGGLGGITEAVYHGVPMLGIPFFADQPADIAGAVRTGFAVKLELDEITEETLEKSLGELLTNPVYTKIVKKRSSLFRNQPIEPMEKAIWWVEHIIEHKGGEHLRNTAVNFEWYQLYMVDIMLFYLILIVVSITISFYTTKWFVKKFYNKFIGCNKKNVEKIKEQ